MKKTVCVVLLLVALVGTLSLFAEAETKEYTVMAVAGKVEKADASGKLEAVTKGMKLLPGDIVNTGLNSRLVLVLKNGDKTIVVSALQKGTVEKLVSTAASDKPGIKMGAKAAESDAAKSIGPERTNVSTASTRAEMAEGETEWVEEEKKPEE